MRYAKAHCTFTPKGELVVIDGPYYDNPNKRRTVSVFKEDLEAHDNGTKRFIQDAFPYLSADDREFLISGMSPEGWEKTFGKEE